MLPIPFLSLSIQHDRIREELEKSFKKVLENGHFILNGEVEAFEQAYAAFTGVNHCITVASGLDAITISLIIAGVGEGDEVIVPALTCSPTWIAVSRIGATLVPVDADDTTFSLDVNKTRQAVTAGTKAIVPVHLYGRPADLISLLKIAAEKNCLLMEDNAQGHGATIGGKRTGSFGHINATSFYPTKNLGALGDGGAVTTNDPVLAAKARQYRNYGLSARFRHEVIGVNSRLDELQAAFLRIKLGHLDDWNNERRQLAAHYEQLHGVGDLVFPVSDKLAEPNYHLFVVCTEQRDKLREHLGRLDIETDIHYPVPPHLQPAYAHLGYGPGTFPVTEKICQTILSLPLWPGMGEDRVEYICQGVKKFFK